mgnify:CR=1 FL=1
MNNHLPTDYQTFIHKSRYAKWLPEKGRRENLPETVDRYMDNVVKPLGEKCPILDDETQYAIYDAILNLEIMPSMRALMTAGKAANRDNTCMYNCSYLPVDHPRSFDEAMFILLCGTGVGFSVERDEIEKLPPVPAEFKPTGTIVVADSKEGWARAYKQLLQDLWEGYIPSWDTSKVRPAGAPLKTFGGRASGPAPLVDLFNFTIEIFKGAAGRKLTDLECHDIMCKVGEIVVVGGVRRSAMISLSNLSSTRMATAKSGDWWTNNPQRALANNSVAYTAKPDMNAFMREWLNLMESGSGERGIFNREASVKQAGRNGRRDTNHSFGTNPCSEIILRPYQFCNLTEVVIRATDTIEDLERKVRLATILGTIQSTYTHFPYLRKVWQKNTEEERLLGVSLTGIMDNKLTTTKNKGLESTLAHLRDIAISTNKDWAGRLGIPVAAAITCVKPSGTVSQLVDSASGIHTRYSRYYVRTVRGDNMDPMTKFMKDSGIPWEPEAFNPEKTTVFSFPVAAPKSAVTNDDVSALDQLETWLVYQRHWCEHKPSVTINVKKDEWMAVGAFVYEHFDEMSGVSFLPLNEHTYQQAPYQEVSWKEYVEMKRLSPKAIDWWLLNTYETEDTTAGSQTLACSGDSCEIVDLT